MVPPTTEAGMVPPTAEAAIVPLTMEHTIDTATDGVVQQAPASPTRSLQQVFEMQRLRAR